MKSEHEVRFLNIDKMAFINKLIKKLGMNELNATTMDVQSIYLSLGYTEEDMNNLNFKEEI